MKNWFNKYAISDAMALNLVSLAVIVIVAALVLTVLRAAAIERGDFSEPQSFGGIIH